MYSWRGGLAEQTLETLGWVWLRQGRLGQVGLGTYSLATLYENVKKYVTFIYILWIREGEGLADVDKREGRGGPQMWTFFYTILL